MTADSSLSRRLALADLPAGVPGRVCALQGGPAVCARLREMGFCEAAVVERISRSGALVCQVCGSRIALSEGAARHVLVELGG